MYMYDSGQVQPAMTQTDLPFKNLSRICLLSYQYHEPVQQAGRDRKDWYRPASIYADNLLEQ